MLVSAIYQHEISHMSPTFWTSFPPPTPSYPSRLSEHQIRAPCIIQQISTGCLNFTHGNGYISVLLSPFVPSSPSCSVSTSLVSVCISTAALQKSSYYSLSQELSRCLIIIISIITGKKASITGPHITEKKNQKLWCQYTGQKNQPRSLWEQNSFSFLSARKPFHRKKRENSISDIKM